MFTWILYGFVICFRVLAARPFTKMVLSASDDQSEACASERSTFTSMAYIDYSTSNTNEKIILKGIMG